MYKRQTYQSGTAVPVGTKINFIAQAAEGYRVQKLVITKNGISDTVITDNRLYDMYEYELTVDTQTDIKVYFTEIEKYTVTVDMPNKNAEITVKNGTSDFESGQKVNFGDEITVTVKPKDGYRLADTESWSDNGDGSYTYKTGRIKMETHILSLIHISSFCFRWHDIRPESADCAGGAPVFPFAA